MPKEEIKIVAGDENHPDLFREVIRGGGAKGKLQKGG